MSADPPRDPIWRPLTEHTSSENSVRVGLIGVPCNRSLSAGRCDLAPNAIRRSIGRVSGHSEPESQPKRFLDFGDLSGTQPDELLDQTPRIADAIGETDLLIALGGDNGATRPLVWGLTEKYGGWGSVGLITIDPHLDNRDLAPGIHNGNVIAALMNDGLQPSNIVQIGRREFMNDPKYVRLAQETGQDVVTHESALKIGYAEAMRTAISQLSDRCKAIHLDLDIDSLDNAFAPACPGARPGGITPEQFYEIAEVAGSSGRVVSVDLVEIDPERDVGDRTSLCAAMIVAHLAASASRSRSV